MENLTKRQKEIFDFIKKFISEMGSAPTVRDIAKHFSISIGPVQRYIKTLIKKGYITHRPEISRGIDLVSRKPIVAVPVLGRVPAGIPDIPLENIEDYVYVDRNIAKSGTYFALKVKGDSMIGSGIFENDYIIVKKQPTAENNEIVVAMIDGEATVKKLHKKNRDVYLESTNPKYKPILAKDITIIGKVIYLMRTYDKWKA